MSVSFDVPSRRPGCIVYILRLDNGALHIRLRLVSKYQKKKTKEILLIFLVRGIGLLFNLLLMYFFVDVVGMNTNIMKTLAKILTTGIVFV